jgi:peptide deformylase
MKLTRKVLYNKAKPVDFKFPWRNKQLADTMLALMQNNNGIGLAAPQCGHSVRMFVMMIDGHSRICVNPVIRQHSDDQIEYDEGCLSFPGDHCIINRPSWVEVTYQDHEGNEINEKLDGIWARCFQHELDHLDGITMWDRHKEQHAKQS